MKYLWIVSHFLKPTANTNNMYNVRGYNISNYLDCFGILGDSMFNEILIVRLISCSYPN